MPISRKVVIECPKCGFTKIVVRGDNLPDKSMFQFCPICNIPMRDSKKSVEEVQYGSNILNDLIDILCKIFKK